MKIISELQINAFRGISNLVIPDLSTVNVFVGANNCGKTSVLEAIRLLATPYSFGTISNLAFLRVPISGEEKKERLIKVIPTIYKKETEDEQTHYLIDIAGIVWKEKFNFSSHGQIDTVYTITGEEKQRFSASVRTQLEKSKANYYDIAITNSQQEDMNMPTTALFSVLYIHAGVNYYHCCVEYLSDSIINERKKELINLLKGFDPNIEDISIINDDVYIHNTVSGTLPLYTYGTGMQKAVMLSAILSLKKNGVILIDEIDNALNISAFGEVFPWFVRSCKEQNVQAFITTHSAEAIDAILDTVRPDDDDIRIITLRKLQKSRDTVAKVRTGAEALTDRNNFKMELRV